MKRPHNSNRSFQSNSTREFRHVGHVEREKKVCTQKAKIPSEAIMASIFLSCPGVRHYITENKTQSHHPDLHKAPRAADNAMSGTRIDAKQTLSDSDQVLWGSGKMNSPRRGTTVLAKHQENVCVCALASVSKRRARPTRCE